MIENEWDDNVFPLAYLVTFRTYGTWLHGDERRSVDTHGGKNAYGSPRIQSNSKLAGIMARNMKRDAFLLDAGQRETVEAAIIEVCKYRTYALHALNVRTNHVHAVVSAERMPKSIINAFKSYSTRKLRELGLIALDEQPWSRGGSRRYLWKPKYVELAVNYVLYCQGDMPFDPEDNAQGGNTDFE